MRQDLKYAIRSLLRNPLFAAAAVLTLALGLGANTAIFSTIDAVLFRPLPVPEPDQLVALYPYNRKTSRYVSASWPELDYFSRHSTRLRSLSAYARVPLRLAVGDRVERVATEVVTSNYFSTLRLAPLLGRAFSREDDTVSTTAPVVMLGERFWRTRFQADPALIGRNIVLQGRPFTVVGIVPATFQGVSQNWGEQPQLWVPLTALPSVIPAFAQADVRNQPAARWLVQIGRLQPDVTLDEAQAELKTLAAQLETQWPLSNQDVTVRVFPGGKARFWPAHRDAITRSLAAFAAAALLVLLLACTNVSSLLFGRALSRQREMAVRLAVGASRSRLIRQLLTENLLLLVPSIALALGVAVVLQRWLTALPNAFGFGLKLDLRLDLRVFLFCVGLATLSTILFGLAPAWRASRTDIIGALRTTLGSGGGVRQLRLQKMLVAVEVTISTILLLLGGLFAKGLQTAYAADPGFQSDALLIVSFDLPPEEYGASGGQALIEDMRAQMNQLPGAESASLAANMPLSAAHHAVQLLDSAGNELPARCNVVGPDFFRTIGVPLRAGREFGVRDNKASAPVVIVNETLAARLWPRQVPLGQTLKVERGPAKGEFQVVGIATNTRYQTVWDDSEPYLYFSAAQVPVPVGNLMIRSRVPPATLIAATRSAWRVFESKAAIVEILTGRDLVNMAFAPQRVATGMLSAFATLAICLAGVGLYGVVSYSVRQRTREIGIRLAMGATPRMIVTQVLRESLTLASAGVIAGGVAGFMAARIAVSYFRWVSLSDGLTYVAVAAFLALAILAASLAPALKAARIDPMTALRLD
jgi:putative ABC transport system permease protein